MKKKLSQKALASLCVLIVLLLTLAIWTIWGNTALMVNTITVSNSQIPSEFTGFRIAQVSDLHNAELGEENAHLLNLLSESQPDIIAITGDLVDAQHTDIDTALSFAEKADRIAPVYYVTGNHEASLPQYEELKTGLEAAGVTVLEDKTIQLEHNGSFVTLIGLSDPNFTIKSNIFDEVPVMISTKLNDLMEDKCADYITDSYTQMQVYVKTLIDLSTASTGYQLNKEIFNLPDYLKQVKVSIDALCRTKEIHLRMSMSNIPMQLTADKVLLGRAIQNVVNNALDYSPQDGTLHICPFCKRRLLKYQSRHSFIPKKNDAVTLKSTAADRRQPP